MDSLSIAIIGITVAGTVMAVVGFTLKRMEDLKAKLSKFEDTLRWYAALGDDDNYEIDKCLERAIIDRAGDKVTVNLGGKYIAAKAREALENE
jgi:hypothetical protein